MNTTQKMIAAMAIVAVLAVAAVGAGYAYTAQTSNTDNSAQTEYYLITSNDGEETPAAKYTDVFNQGVNFNTVTSTAGTTTYTMNGTTITALTKTVSSLGNSNLVIVDQDKVAPAVAPTAGTHYVLHIALGDNSTATAHHFNDNFTYIASLSAFTEDSVAQVGEINTNTAVTQGYVVLAPGTGDEAGFLVGDLFVATGTSVVQVYIGAYLTNPSAILDEDMAYDSPALDGANDSDVLYKAVVNYTVDSTKAAGVQSS